MNAIAVKALSYYLELGIFALEAKLKKLATRNPACKTMALRVENVRIMGITKYIFP